jgi:hypothetical protein
VKKSLIAFGELLVSDEELSKTVKPGMRRFHNPTSVLRRTSTSALLSRDPWYIAPYTDLLSDRIAVIALIRIKEALRPGRRDDDRIEHCGELADVMSMGPGNDQRQRDAMSVHQDVPLASLFSPDLSGSGRLLLEPGAL